MNVYDFDGTIYKGDSTVDFYFYCLGRKPSLMRYLPKQMKGFILYAFKRIDKTDMKERFFSFLNGIDSEKEVKRFWDKHMKNIYSWYTEQQRNDDVIISASPEFLLKEACSRLGINSLIASRVDNADGKYDGKNCHDVEKVARFREIYPEGKVDKFYSDSRSDSYMAELASEAFMIKKGKIEDWE